MEEPKRTCEGCKYYLGGIYGYCKIGYEDECGDGMRELWEAELPGVVVI